MDFTQRHVSITGASTCLKKLQMALLRMSRASDECKEGSLEDVKQRLERLEILAHPSQPPVQSLN